MPVGRSVVEMHSVSKVFGGRLAVDQLGLEVQRGECVGLLGPNGAGKTTSLRMIYGVTRPTAGSVRVFDTDVLEHPREIRRRLGVTLQENAVVEEISARDNLRIFARCHGLRRYEAEAKIETLTDWLQLRASIELPVRALSGGAQRRLAIALSLLNNPELWILDEPTTGLDPAVRRNLWARIRELRDGGRTIILTTHYIEEAQRLCDRVVIMRNGRAVCSGTPRELIATHTAREALELDCTPEDEERIFHDWPSESRLRAGSQLIVFVEDSAAAIARVRERDKVVERELISRPTNLEDVFLAVTGTHLEDGA